MAVYEKFLALYLMYVQYLNVCSMLLFFFSFAVMEIEPRVLCMVDKHTVIELHSHPYMLLFRSFIVIISAAV